MTASAAGAGGESPWGTFGIEGVVSRYWKRGARWNDTFTGTWASVDPIAVLNDPSRANPYAFAGDNPLNQMDPAGNSSIGEYASACGQSAVTGLAIGAVGVDETGVGAVADAAGGCAEGLAATAVDDVFNSDLGSNLEDLKDAFDLGAKSESGFPERRHNAHSGARRGPRTILHSGSRCYVEFSTGAGKRSKQQTSATVNTKFAESCCAVGECPTI